MTTHTPRSPRGQGRAPRSPSSRGVQRPAGPPGPPGAGQTGDLTFLLSPSSALAQRPTAESGARVGRFRPARAIRPPGSSPPRSPSSCGGLCRPASRPSGL